MFNFQPFQSPVLFFSKHFESFWGEAPSGPSTGSSAATSTSEVPRSDVGNLHDSSCEWYVFHEGESDHSELVFLPKLNLLEVQAVWRAEPQVWKDKHEG